MRKKQANVSNDAALRAFIYELLKEDYGGGDFGGYGDFGYYGYGGGDMMGYGFGDMSSTGTKSAMYKTFIEPFADVLKTAKAGAEEISTRAWTALKVATQYAVSSIIPDAVADYDQIFAQEKEELSKIKTKYAEVFKRTNEAFYHDDALVSAFMLNPGIILTAAFIQKAPAAVADLLSIFASGNAALTNYLQKLKGDLPASGSSKAQTAKPTKEQPKKHKREEAALEALISLSKKPQINRLVNNSDISLNVAKDAQSILKKAARKIIDNVQKATKAKTLDELKALYPRLDLSKLDGLKPEEKPKAEQILMAQVKAGIKNLYTKRLVEQIKNMEKAGYQGPEVSELKKALNAISSLK